MATPMPHILYAVQLDIRTCYEYKRGTAMNDDDFPDFLQLNGFRVKPGMFDAGRTPSGHRP